MTGSAGQQRVPKKFLEDLQIPLPPLAEQKRIAAILDQADDLRRKRQRALDHLGQLGQAIFMEMFGDPATNPMGWAVVTLDKLLLNVTNGLTRRRRPGDVGSHIVLRLRDIRDGEIDFSDVNRITLDEREQQRFEAAVDDLLFIRVNGNPEYVGRCAVLTRQSEPIFFNDHVMRVRVNRDRVSPVFLQRLLSSPHGKREIARNRKTSAGQHTINQSGLGQVGVPLPPMEVQMEFEDRLRAIGAIGNPMRKSASRSELVFAALQHHAFRGEL
jgi:restriction endonuclease S subunit